MCYSFHSCNKYKSCFCYMMYSNHLIGHMAMWIARYIHHILKSLLLVASDFQGIFWDRSLWRKQGEEYAIYLFTYLQQFIFPRKIQTVVKKKHLFLMQEFNFQLWMSHFFSNFNIKYSFNIKWSKINKAPCKVFQTFSILKHNNFLRTALEQQEWAMLHVKWNNRLCSNVIQKKPWSICFHLNTLWTNFCTQQ